MSGSANKTHRQGAPFFMHPENSGQRRYEALRSYFVDKATAAEVARRFGYQPSTVQTMIRDFRAGDRDFFLVRKPGPRRAPAKEAARELVLKLRRSGHSVVEIAEALRGTRTSLNRTGVWEILRDEGFERLAFRSQGERGGPVREHPPRVRVIRWPETPVRRPSEFAGTMLLIPGLVVLKLGAAVKAAGMPGTREVPAVSSILSLLALKMITRRRVSHVDDVCHDPGLASFAGLETLPKATALGTYSYRLDRHRTQALLRRVGRVASSEGQADGSNFDLDFHSIMHYGDDVALETHYVPRRSQRTEAILTFFAQDGATHNLLYANATCRNADRSDEALRFARHWKQTTGRLPELLVFDSKVTTGAGLYKLDQAGVRFLTLRQRNAKLTERLGALPEESWTKITVSRTGPYSRPLVCEENVRVRGCPIDLRQIAVKGLGHDRPTLILTNDRTSTPAQLVNRYVKRMTIEQRLAESIRTFHLDALSSAVALNVDLDTTLTCVAQLAYDALRRRLSGYENATPDTIWRRFVSTRGCVTLGPKEVLVRLRQRTYSPVMRSASLPEVRVPWWGGRRLRFEFA